MNKPKVASKQPAPNPSMILDAALVVLEELQKLNSAKPSHPAKFSVPDNW